MDFQPREEKGESSDRERRHPNRDRLMSALPERAQGLSLPMDRVGPRAGAGGITPQTMPPRGKGEQAVRG